MPKMKTHSGIKKRVKKLKSGKFKAAHAGRRKMLTKKSAKCKRAMRMKLIIHPADAHALRHLLPY
jgi:large subunit ribosomal protein L35